MDGSRFDAWTRRHFGLAATGLIASLAGFTTIESADAKKKKKKKKKKCRNLGQVCRQSGKKKKCCGKKGLSCQQILPGEPNEGELRCCRKGFESCTFDSECCSGSCTDGFCACKSDGFECGGFDALCCSLNCTGSPNSTCQPG